MTPEWVLPQEELRKRIRAILDDRQNNGWTPTCLGLAMDLECTSVISKSKGGWIFPGEQNRMSRVIRLIEAGRLVPGKALYNSGYHGWGVRTKLVPEMVKPEKKPEPKLMLSAKMGKSGPVLKIDKQRIYSHEDLYRNE